MRCAACIFCTGRGLTPLDRRFLLLFFKKEALRLLLRYALLPNFHAIAKKLAATATMSVANA
jgi:hypothetical protein